MLEIRYISPPAYLASIYGDPLFIDVSGTEQLAISKAVDRGDITQVSQEAALGISLPATPKNRAIFDQFFPDTINKQTVFINVEVRQNGEILPLTGLEILEFDGQNFEGEFFGDDWLTQLENFLIKDLGPELGTYEFTKANILASWNGDRQQLAMPILADWGMWGSDLDNQDGPGAGKVQFSDLRISFNAGLLMQKIFCALNPKWNFVSPYYTGAGEGRHAYAYLSGKRFYSHSGKEDQLFVSLNTTAPVGMVAGENFPIFDEVQDDDNAYNDNIIFPGVYIWQGLIDYNNTDIRFEVRNLVVTLPPPPAGQPAYTFTFVIYRTAGFGSALEYLHRETAIGSADQTVTRTLNFDFVDEAAVPDRGYGFILSYQDKTVTDGSYSTFTLTGLENIFIRPDSPRYLENSTIPLHEIIDPELNARDLLESMGLINPKFFTDYSSRTVYMFPPFSYTMLDGETVIEGFYQNGAPLDLRPNTIPNQITWENQETTRERFLTFKFKDGDGYLQSIDDEGRFNRTVDLGTGENKTKEVENPLFVGTGELQVHSDYVGGTGDITVPAIWSSGNDGTSLSYEVGVRLLVFYGMIDQGQTWQFEDDILTEVPYFSQLPNSIELPSTVDLVALTFSSGYDRNLYDLFYRQETGCNATLFKILLTGGDDIYNAINFRRKLLIQGETSAFEVIPSAVRDHITGSRVPLLLEARPA